MPRTGSVVPGQPIEVLFLVVRVCRVQRCRVRLDGNARGERLPQVADPHLQLLATTAGP